MTGKDLVEELKKRGEWGAYFTYEGYEFIKSLRSAREICVALRAWGAADVSPTDSAAVLLDKFDRALRGQAHAMLTKGGLPDYHL